MAAGITQSAQDNSTSTASRTEKRAIQRTQRPKRNMADVGKNRESRRQHRLTKIALVLGPIALWMWFRMLTGDPVGLPTMPNIDPMYLITGVFFGVLILVLLGTQVAAGRSPHVMFRPEQISTKMDDVVGMPVVSDEVNRSLDLFLAGPSFKRDLGGTPRRGLLFEGHPGTGKTLMAKAMAAEAGVPFLFVSATSFQSMYYGATARKIRSFFKALRKTAAKEGGAIAFIEEIDAIGMARGGMSSAMSAAPQLNSSAQTMCCGGLAGLDSATDALLAQNASSAFAGAASSGVITNHNMTSEGVGGVVNELLIQMQSFEMPTGWQKAQGAVTDAINLLLPATVQIPRPRVEPVNVLVIAATNRADNLDPALLRPGRFDRRLHFDLPDHAGRRALIDYYLARKAHVPDLDADDRRNALAGVTQGYSPVKIEQLLDEGLINAVRRGARAMNWKDIEQARLTIDVGLGQPVGYTNHEAELIATHEAGHTVTAWLVAPERRLDIVSIVKRGGALGLLSHGDQQDTYTRTSGELNNHIRIALGGMVAEELFYGDTTTGPSSDLAYATRVAAEMVGNAGMGESLLSHNAGAGGMLGGDSVSRVMSDPSTREEMEELLQSRRGDVRCLLAEHKHLVEGLRTALLAQSELIGTEIDELLSKLDREAGHVTQRPVKMGSSVAIELAQADQMAAQTT